jgi:hypothetical protein
LSAAPSADAVALQDLARSGSDLSKLHRVEFRLRFPTQSAAERAELQLQELAFETTVESPESGDDWLVLALKNMYPVESDLLGLRDKLQSIAKEGRGAYVGWTARVK